VYLSQDDLEAANGYTAEELAVQTRHPIAGYLNMTKTMIGAGILALPSAFNKVHVTQVRLVFIWGSLGFQNCTR
jgi:hypothetical protein